METAQNFMDNIINDILKDSTKSEGVTFEEVLQFNSIDSDNIDEILAETEIFEDASETQDSQDLEKEKRNSRPKIQRPLSASFNMPAVPQNTPRKTPKNMSRPAIFSEKRFKNIPPSPTFTSTPQTPRKLGAIPAYLKKSKPFDNSHKELETIKKKLDGEKAKLFPIQEKFMKTFSDCKKIFEKASQALDEKYKLVVIDDEPNQTVSKADYQKIIHDALNEIKLEVGDSDLISVSKIEDFLLNELLPKLKLKQTARKTEEKVDEKFEMASSKPDIQALNKKLKQSEKTANDQLKRLNSQTKEMQAMRKKIEELESEKLNMENVVKDKNYLIKNFESRMRRVPEHVTTNSILETEMDLLRLENENLSNENAKLQDTISKVGEEKDKFMLEVIKIKKQMAEDLESQCKIDLEMKESTENDMIKIKAELYKEQANSRIQKELLDLRGSIIQKLSEADTVSRVTIKELKEKISSYETDASRKNLVKEASREELQNLFNTLASKQLEIDRLEHKLQKLKKITVTHEATIIKLQDNLIKLQKKYENLQDCRSALSKFD